MFHGDVSFILTCPHFETCGVLRDFQIQHVLAMDNVDCQLLR